MALHKDKPVEKKELNEPPVPPNQVLLNKEDPSVFEPFARDERVNYCAGLENLLMQKQIQINVQLQQIRLYEEHSRKLMEECRALQAELKQNRKKQDDFLNSRGYFLACMLHFVFALLSRNRQAVREGKIELRRMLLAQSGEKRNLTLRRKIGLAGRNLLIRLKTGPEAAAQVLRKAEPQRDYYVSEYQEDEKFERLPSDLFAVAFYLPQFHCIPENDQWWGKGFTEWVNTRKSRPRFPGHYQPRIPHDDIGYYDLSQADALKQQAKLAKAHGIKAFCMYYYWFDGKKLLETPVELLLAHPEIDIQFCLCWANENWTRAWDGQEKEILIKQDYSTEGNDVAFIRDLKKYLMDPRYLRNNGKPVVLIYHAKILPDPDATFRTWRDWCRKNGVGEIEIWSCRTFIQNGEFNKSPQVDHEVEFPPHMVGVLELINPEKFGIRDDSGYFYNYNRIIDDVTGRRTMADQSPYPIYRCAMLGWDNACRRKNGWSVWQYFSLKKYHAWLTGNIEYTRRKFPKNERYLFINAWNEWAEGTYLEPDRKYGYASINVTTRALAGLPCLPEYRLLPFIREIPETTPGRILIHFHCFYPELADEMIVHLNHMPWEYDCVVTTDTAEKKSRIKRALKRRALEKCRKLRIRVFSNHGRDVRPFFLSCAGIIGKYDFVGHFHTKRSTTVNWGDEWRHYLWSQLLGSPDRIASIFRLFARQENAGLYFPVPHPAFRTYKSWEDKMETGRILLEKMGLEVDLPDEPFFPVGQMFWAKVKALAPAFARNVVDVSDFEPENEQISGTLAHALERLWKYIAAGSGYQTFSAVLPPIPPPAVESKKVRRLAVYVHYQKENTVSAPDLYCLRSLAECADICFVTNSDLNPAEENKLKGLVRKMVKRKNVGFDFGAWRDALKQLDWTDYDEVVLMNNSVVGPFIPFTRIFGAMAENPADFWGMTEFPETRNPRREEAKAFPEGVIPAHVQSYFMVFRKRVLNSDAFRKFWSGVRNEKNIIQVISKYETRLSGELIRAGFCGDVWFRTAAALQNTDIVTPEFNALYCRPLDFIILGFPFLKKNICYYLSQEQINETLHALVHLTGYPTEILTITSKQRG